MKISTEDVFCHLRSRKQTFFGILGKNKWWIWIQDHNNYLSAKLCPVWINRGEMRGLFGARKLAWHVLCFAFESNNSIACKELISKGKPKSSLKVQNSATNLFKCSITSSCERRCLTSCPNWGLDDFVFPIINNFPKSALKILDESQKIICRYLKLVTNLHTVSSDKILKK